MNPGRVKRKLAQNTDIMSAFKYLCGKKYRVMRSLRSGGRDRGGVEDASGFWHILTGIEQATSPRGCGAMTEHFGGECSRTLRARRITAYLPRTRINQCCADATGLAVIAKSAGLQK